MRTFGWAPSEGELQELVGEIDQVERGAKKIILTKLFWQRMEMVVSPSTSLCG